MQREKKRTPGQIATAVDDLYSEPEIADRPKKRRKRFKRKCKDAEERPEMIWKNRKTNGNRP